MKLEYTCVINEQPEKVVKRLPQPLFTPPLSSSVIGKLLPPILKDNSLVYYTPHSLSGKGTVVNSKIKGTRT